MGKKQQKCSALFIMEPKKKLSSLQCSLAVRRYCFFFSLFLSPCIIFYILNQEKIYRGEGGLSSGKLVRGERGFFHLGILSYDLGWAVLVVVVVGT